MNREELLNDVGFDVEVPKPKGLIANIKAAEKRPALIMHEEAGTSEALIKAFKRVFEKDIPRTFKVMTGLRGAKQFEEAMKEVVKGDTIYFKEGEYE